MFSEHEGLPINKFYFLKRDIREDPESQMYTDCILVFGVVDMPLFEFKLWYLTTFFHRARTLPRSVLIICTQVVMIITYMLFSLGQRATLYISVALLGICYGVQFSVIISISSELFGLKHFGKIYNFIALANPVGAFLFNTIAGYIYDLEVAKQKVGREDTDIACHGPECFRLTFYVLTGAACLGTLLSTVLTVRVRPVYQMLYAGGSFSQPRSSAH